MNLIYWAKRFKRLLFLKLKLETHCKTHAPYLWLYTAGRVSINGPSGGLLILKYKLTRKA